MFSGTKVTALARVLKVVIAQLRRKDEYHHSQGLREKASHCTIEDLIAISLSA